MELYNKEKLDGSVTKSDTQTLVVELGDEYVNSEVLLSFKIKTFDGLESSGKYQDTIKVEVNDMLILSEYLGDGSGESYGIYSLIANTDADGVASILFSLLCTGNAEKYDVSDITINSTPIIANNTDVVNCNELKLEADSSMTKYYHFGMANANRNVNIKFLANSVVGWNEYNSDNDVFKVKVNGKELVSTSTSQKHSHDLEFKTDKNGDVTVILEDITDGDKGQVYIKEFVVTMLLLKYEKSSDAVIL